MARSHREDMPSDPACATVEQWRAVIARTCLPIRRARPSSNGAPSRLAQDVAHAAHGVQQAPLASGLGLAAQVADVDAQRVRRRAEVVAPDALEERRARQHLARMLEEELEQRELGLGELDAARAATDLVGRAIEHEVAE